MLEAFMPQGNTVLVAATSSTSVAPTQLSTGNVMGCRLSNPSSVTIYVAVGSSSVAASQPSTGTPSAGMPIPAGGTGCFNFSPSLVNNWLSAVTSAGTAPPGLFATPGYGIN